MTAGQAEYIEPLACAGVAAGVDGVFLEVHEEPSRAKSDAQNALRLDQLEPLLHRLHGDRRDREAAGGAPAWLTTRVARKVLETEAAAILALDRSPRRQVRLRGASCSATARAA